MVVFKVFLFSLRFLTRIESLLRFLLLASLVKVESTPDGDTEVFYVVGPVYRTIVDL